MGGGDGYTGKLYAEASTCVGTTTNLVGVKTLARIEDDGSATLVAEDCNAIVPIKLSSTQISSGTLKYNRGAGDVTLTVKQPQFSAANGDGLVTPLFRFYEPVTTDHVLTVDQYEFQYVTRYVPDGNGFNVFTKSTPTRLPLYRCVTPDRKFHFASPDQGCELQINESQYGYIEAQWTAWAPQRLYRCSAPMKGWYHPLVATDCPMKGLFLDFLMGYIPFN